MPSQQGRRDADVSFRPLRRRGRSAPRLGPIVSVVAVLAIVGAYGSQPAVLARTPSNDRLAFTLVSTDRTDRRVVAGVGGLVAIVPTVGLLDLPDRGTTDGAADPGVTSLLLLDTVPPVPPIAEVTVPRAGAPRSGESASRTKPTRAPRPQARPDRSPFVSRSRWRIAPAASWYGPGFYGNTTACGRTYTKRIVGVAHRTLPCGTLVQLRWHGQTAVVPVIDRGPFGAARNVFDFSARLACVVFRPKNAADGCFTRYRVHWRVVDRRRT